MIMKDHAPLQRRQTLFREPRCALHEERTMIMDSLRRITLVETTSSISLDGGPGEHSAQLDRAPLSPTSSLRPVERHRRNGTGSEATGEIRRQETRGLSNGSCRQRVVGRSGNFETPAFCSRSASCAAPPPIRERRCGANRRSAAATPLLFDREADERPRDEERYDATRASPGRIFCPDRRPPMPPTGRIMSSNNRTVGKARKPERGYSVKTGIRGPRPSWEAVVVGDATGSDLATVLWSSLILTN
ncbi:hypothetical protein KM043_004322 [Ampulex compressa]|nr:hypothetical protein KM043_004322 [Ampulex compressa]